MGATGTPLRQAHLKEMYYNDLKEYHRRHRVMGFSFVNHVRTSRWTSNFDMATGPLHSTRGGAESITGKDATNGRTQCTINECARHLQHLAINSGFWGSNTRPPDRARGLLHSGGVGGIKISANWLSLAARRGGATREVSPLVLGKYQHERPPHWGLDAEHLGMSQVGGGG